MSKRCGCQTCHVAPKITPWLVFRSRVLRVKAFMEEDHGVALKSPITITG